MATNNGGEIIFGGSCQETLQIPNFVEISLSVCTVSEINALLHLTQKFKMAAKNGGKTIFGENSPIDPADTPWVKKCH